MEKYMIKTVVKQYRLKNPEVAKKAVFITFDTIPTGSNFTEYKKELQSLLQSNYDSYIFTIPNKKLFTTYGLKIMLRVNQSNPGKTGILTGEELQGLLTGIKLNSIFNIDINAAAVIKKIEKNVNKNNR